MNENKVVIGKTYRYFAYKVKVLKKSQDLSCMFYIEITKVVDEKKAQPDSIGFKTWVHADELS